MYEEYAVLVYSSVSIVSVHVCHLVYITIGFCVGLVQVSVVLCELLFLSGEGA